MKHEIAYVLGQMQNPLAIPSLINQLQDTREDVMVKHEAAEALGAIGDRRALSILQQYRDDSEIVLDESCEVALDLLELVASKRFEYTD